MKDTYQPNTEKTMTWQGAIALPICWLSARRVPENRQAY